MRRAGEVRMVGVGDSGSDGGRHNRGGGKGGGEAGAIGSPPALVNAVLDALNAGGHSVAPIDMPLTPQPLWSALNA